MIRAWSLIGLLTLLASCASPPPERVNTYFDFDSLINRQIDRLLAMRASISKEAHIDGKTDQAFFEPDSTHWSYEMDMFRNLNAINKPVNQSFYEVVDGVKDLNSNLLTKTLAAKRNAHVQRLTFFYEDSFDKLRKIEAIISEETTLYATSRTLKMQFDNHGNELLLSAYSIEGVQKIILSDSVRFSIQVRVRMENPS